jgi:hypothetical protein
MCPDVADFTLAHRRIGNPPGAFERHRASGCVNGWSMTSGPPRVGFGLVLQTGIAARLTDDANRVWALLDGFDRKFDRVDSAFLRAQVLCGGWGHRLTRPKSSPARWPGPADSTYLVHPDAEAKAMTGGRDGVVWIAVRRASAFDPWLFVWEGSRPSRHDVAGKAKEAWR